MMHAMMVNQLSGRTATAWQDESMKPYTFQRKVPHCHFASGISLPYYRQPLLSIYIYHDVEGTSCERSCQGYICDT